tara:strand:+ start:156 stop:437 length:282 start_codon:yes stop_codon:yes gene_type:complete
MHIDEEFRIKDEPYTGKKITNVKKGSVVEITMSDGSFEAVIQKMNETLMVVTLLTPMTSSKAHSYHWESGSLKSVLFERILKLKDLNLKEEAA